MRTEDLIVDLARRGHPVRALRPARVRFAAYAAIALALTAAGVLIKGPRADASVVMGETSFVASAALTLVMTIAAGWAATVSAVPGAAEAAMLRRVAIGAGGLWIVGIMWTLSKSGPPFEQLAQEPIYLACLAKVVLLALVPAAAILVMVRRAAPLHAGWTSGLAALGALGFGAAGAQWICPIDRPAHLLGWHVVPVIVLTALAATCGTFLLGKNPGTQAGD